MKFRKKALVVDAVQWVGQPDLPGLRKRLVAPPLNSGWGDDNYWQWYVTTIHGDEIVIAPGDWIVTEPDGIHHYPVRMDIFEKTYEAVSE